MTPPQRIQRLGLSMAQPHRHHHRPPTGNTRVPPHRKPLTWVNAYETTMIRYPTPIT